MLLPFVANSVDGSGRESGLYDRADEPSLLQMMLYVSCVNVMLSLAVVSVKVQSEFASAGFTNVLLG